MTQNDVQKGIKNARDILVGKVPDPMSQVKQITLALMYKFIDDMDQSAEEMDGKATFFTGEYKQYAWHSLMDVKIGNQERMNLYAEALEKLPFNENLPQLFREIFKDAFLSYRDPNTLSLFLKEINNFSYDNSENLGSAFEHLLSVMSSQGDAGQFRTPRHIINFIVEAVNPGKTDTVLDPACGTAGFLISAYKHILKTNENKLNPDERKRISDSFAGYDISPDMVRLSLVNLYLHGFKQPKIVEYDTLGSDSKWNEFYDVILANPPFMSPRGGIKPHKRFEVQANRSEVLFVDYIMEHLTPNGRGGVIVPEGIIFQSANAYKALRKMLIDNNFLYAVVSLPAGVFNPYAGVKTSILLMDRVLAKKAKGILFVKIQNDGLDLGAQRRPIEKNDLPKALQIIKEYQENSDKEIISDLAHVVSKTKIAESGDYNLSGDRYKEVVILPNQKWPMVELGEVCDIYQPKTITSKEINLEQKNGWYKVFGANGVIGYYHSYNHEFPEVIVTCRGATCGTVNLSDHKSWITGNAMVVHPKSAEKLIKQYLYYLLKHSDLTSSISGTAQPQITRVSLAPRKIPLPTIEVQKEIVEQIDKYQKIIDGAKQIIVNWKPKIDIDPEWEKVKLEEVCDVKSGGTPPTNQPSYYENGDIPWLKSEVCKDEIVIKPKTFITKEGLKNSSAKWLVENTTLIALVGATIGKTAIITFKATTNQNVAGLYPKNSNQLDPFYLYLMSQTLYDIFMKLGDGGFKMANLSFLKDLQIPLPSLEIQKQIVEKIEAERELVEANKKLIEIMEDKIKKVIGKL